MSRVPSRKRTWIQMAAAAVSVALLILILRLTWDAHQFAAHGEQQVQKGAYAEACDAFMDAARAYYPGNPYSNVAFARLLALADPALRPPNAPADLERRALEAFRTAAMATRSLYVPHAAELATVNERLAYIYAQWELKERAAYKGAAASLQQRQQWHLVKLREVPGPSWFWSTLALLGLALSVGAVVLFIGKALSPTLQVNRGPALGAGLAFVVGFALFLLGLSR